MGLSRSLERRAAIESDIIIGVIDTGIWPESESFNDEGYGPIPTKWKGECNGGKDFVCNRNIIGARSYIVDSKELSARDTAIADGVDIISISLGNDDPVELNFDPIAIGAFHAIERGIPTVNFAGNKGPSRASINSYAPWIFTVAASDIDRKIVDKLLLGKDATLVGHAINVFPSSDEPLPLVYGKEVTSRCSETYANSLVDHKVVLCDQEPILEEVKKSRASGFIYPSLDNYSLVMPSPVVALSRDDLNSPIDNPGAPFVAPFSSRGPSIYMHDMIKNFVEFSILYGTSMACPHVATAVAFVKSFHPDWSPSAIKSALMTTGPSVC
ncbi:putative cucumisin [Helianthus anomalus]